MSPSNLLLGIDGGGTKTVAWIAPLDDDTNTVVLGRGEAGPGNPRSAGFEATEINILAAIAGAFADANLPPSTAVAACFGLAGAGRHIEQNRLVEWATLHGIAQSVRVTSDAEPVIAAASPDDCGIALICGTGSLAWGRNAAGQIARAGGWGYLMGDEGSAYAIALAGLKAISRAADGRGPSTAIREPMLAELHVQWPDDFIDQVYSPHTTRQRLASLAKIVFDVAPADPVAQAIIAAAAADLAEIISTLCRRLQFPGGAYTLALAGSVILNQPALRQSLQNQLAQRDESPANTVLVTDPVRGAIAIARQLSGTTALKN